MSGFVTFTDVQTADAFTQHCAWLSLQVVSGYEAIGQQTQKEPFLFYIVGHAALIVFLRKLLTRCGFPGSQIMSKGFWQ